MLRLIVVLTLFLSLYSCGPRILDHKLAIIQAIHDYTIARRLDNPNSYVIYATSAQRAQKAADNELQCKNKICHIEPAGVIYFVEIPQ